MFGFNKIIQVINVCMIKYLKLESLSEIYIITAERHVFMSILIILQIFQSIRYAGVYFLQRLHCFCYKH